MAKYEAKTIATEASVAAYVDAIADAERREDCRQLQALMQRATGEPAKMWGAGIVGFGSYHYKYASGHEGDSCLVGFASRKGDISVYLPASSEGAEVLFAELGRHKRAKGCLYLRKLSDIQLPVLEKIVLQAVAEVRRRYASP